MRLKVGSRYHILFLDHSAFIRGKTLCETFGLIESQNKDYVTVVVWNLLTDDSEDIIKENREIMEISKRSIVWTKLIAKPPQKILDSYLH